MRETERKVFNFIKENRMIDPEDSIVLGVSGGVDSVCLFELLLKYRAECPFRLTVVHINHGIREDAAEDARFVEKLCADRDIPFVLFETDIHALASEEKCSVEDAGRRFRYACFEQVRAERAATKIAVAHNANDRAETVLLHLFRGTGLRGLRGIEPKRDNIIRPLLVLERSEIEGYVSENGISYREDSTNQTDDYARNRVRHHLLPLAEKEVSGNAVEHLCRTAQYAAEAENFLAELTARAYDACVKESYVEVESFLSQPDILRKRVLLALLERLSPTGKDIGTVHVEEAYELFTQEGNRRITLPFGITLRRSYDKVWYAEPETEGEDSLSKVTLQKISIAQGTSFPQNSYTKWFDYDKIVEPVEVRFRKTGDYLTIADGKGGMRHKSLKEYMITEKIPAERRDSIPVVASGSHILWLVGYRISEYFKTDGATTTVLAARYRADSEEIK